jgi:hypothetical protein
VSMVFEIVSLALAVGSLVAALYTLSSSRRMVVAVVLITATIATSAVALVQRWSHARHIDALERRIVATLGNRTWTAETLCKEVFPASYDDVNEALIRGTNREVISSRHLELRSPDGEILDVHAYSVRQEPGPS